MSLRASCFYSFPDQKTREGCGRFRDLFGGSRGQSRENSARNDGFFFPESRRALLRGPNDQKKKSMSLEISISIEILNLARKFQSRRLDFPTKIVDTEYDRAKVPLVQWK